MSGEILADSEIARAVDDGRIRIDPFDPAQLNPASYDLRLGDQVAVYEEAVKDPDTDDLSYEVLYVSSGAELDSKVEQKVHSWEFDGGDGLVLCPGVLYLMHTVERIATDCYVTVIDGKSSIGRLGISIHQTAGYGDPGFDGQYTLEVTAVHPVRVYAGMRFAQARFHTLTGEVRHPYAGNYRGEHSVGPVPSRAWRQFK